MCKALSGELSCPCDRSCYMTPVIAVYSCFQPNIPAVQKPDTLTPASTCNTETQSTQATSTPNTYQTQESQLNDSEPVCPELVGCDHSVEKILPQLTSSIWLVCFSAFVYFPFYTPKYICQGVYSICAMSLRPSIQRSVCLSFHQ